MGGRERGVAWESMNLGCWVQEGESSTRVNFRIARCGAAGVEAEVERDEGDDPLDERAGVRAGASAAPFF